MIPAQASQQVIDQGCVDRRQHHAKKYVTDFQPEQNHQRDIEQGGSQRAWDVELVVEVDQVVGRAAVMDQVEVPVQEGVGQIDILFHACLLEQHGADV